MTNSDLQSRAFRQVLIKHQHGQDGPSSSRFDRSATLRYFLPQTGLCDTPLILADMLPDEKWKLF